MEEGEGLFFISKQETLPHTRTTNSCLVGKFTNIEKSHTQTAKLGTTISRPYKYRLDWPVGLVVRDPDC